MNTLFPAHSSVLSSRICHLSRTSALKQILDLFINDLHNQGIVKAFFKQNKQISWLQINIRGFAGIKKLILKRTL